MFETIIRSLVSVDDGKRQWNKDTELDSQLPFQEVPSQEWWKGLEDFKQLHPALWEDPKLGDQRFKSHQDISMVCLIMIFMVCPMVKVTRAINEMMTRWWWWHHADKRIFVVSSMMTRDTSKRFSSFSNGDSDKSYRQGNDKMTRVTSKGASEQMSWSLGRRVPTSSHLVVDYHWLSLVITDYHWLPLIITDYHWLSFIIIDYHWL